MLILSAYIWWVSGAIGTLISALGSGWPTGPFIVVVAAVYFIISLVIWERKRMLIHTIYSTKDV